MLHPNFTLYFQGAEEVEDVYEITHRVYLDVDIDKQRIGMSCSYLNLSFSY